MALVRQRATLSLYVDGTLADTKTASTEAIIYQPIEPFRIGRSAGTGENSPFAPNGAFDDLYLYRKALTQCEVIQLVGRQNCVAPPTPTSVTLPPTATPVPTATPTPYPTPDRSPQINVTMEGVGSVTSNPAGINCAAGVCKLNYPSSVTSVTLTANPIPGGSFIGWQAWPCPTTGATCTVNPNQIVFVRARFNPQPTPQPSGVYPPQINVNVKGPGTVTSEPSGVNCTAGWCQNMFPASATSVKLTANAPAGSIFRGWGAWPCPATGATCTVNPNQVVYVTAAFDGNQTVTLAIDQPENGTIRANVKGVYTNELICYSSGGGICEGEMPINSSIDVLALHIEGSAAWDGPCEGEWLVHLGYCPFTITKNTTVRSIFSDIGLWMVKATAPAHGAIRLSNGYERGTTCPGERCAIPLRLDEPLTATVIPDAGYVFDRWGDACAGQGATCRITPPGDKAERTVTAFFKLR